MLDREPLCGKGAQAQCHMLCTVQEPEDIGVAKAHTGPMFLNVDFTIAWWLPSIAQADVQV